MRRFMARAGYGRPRIRASYSVSTTLGVVAGTFLAGGALQLAFAAFCLGGMIYLSAVSASALCDLAVRS